MLPDFDVLKTREIRVLDSYSVEDDLKGGLLLKIQPIDKPLDDDFALIVYYDGGKHAIFLRNKNMVVVCDHVHPGVRQSLRLTKTVSYREQIETWIAKDKKETKTVREYTAELVLCDDVEPLAERLIDLSKRKDRI